MTVATTTTEAPVLGASELAELLELEPEPLTAREAAAIAADILRRAEQGPPPSIVARSCRCRRRWEFERGHCGRCGHDLRAATS